ncbi:ABC transporter permease [Pelagibius litoralis]|uniref:ABC transporter permease n=2 Tax=Pelagibius litoralis TaxID=374515 RepID=A0A967CBK4_9PROT|nr:ABC transporter permease [Pelagibius litoralis]
MNTPGIKALTGSLSRITAVFVKELIQMRRDRMTFAMMLAIPVLQLVLFGYAINNDPKHLPTAVHVEERTPIVRSLLTALETSEYYDLVFETADPRESARLLARGDVSFVVSIPVGFTERLVRGERPQLLIEADASDPAASSNAVARAEEIVNRALRHDLKGALDHLAPVAGPVEVIIHSRYNPEAITQYNIVPGLLGVILTMTLVMITAIAMTREAERGTMENLLAMPARPHEVMIGKIAPYIGVGGVQTVIILIAARFLFDVPFTGALWLLLAGVVLFLIANLALGFTFSTIAKSQMQAMQLTFFFFLPSILLSGFMFPYRGMPAWAQVVGEALPLTHFLRIVRGVMLKGAGYADVQNAFLAIAIFTVVVGIIAMTRYKRTLD